MRAEASNNQELERLGVVYPPEFILFLQDILSKHAFTLTLPQLSQGAMAYHVAAESTFNTSSVSNEEDVDMFADITQKEKKIKSDRARTQKNNRIIQLFKFKRTLNLFFKSVFLKKCFLEMGKIRLLRVLFSCQHLFIWGCTYHNGLI
jgi:glycyl-tRNA synthetase beta subunit